MVRRPSQKRPVGRGKKARPSGRVRCHPLAAAMPPVSELESPKLKSTGREPGRQLNPLAAAADTAAAAASASASSSVAAAAGSEKVARLPPAADIGDRTASARLDPCPWHVTCCSGEEMWSLPVCVGRWILCLPGNGIGITGIAIYADSTRWWGSGDGWSYPFTTRLRRGSNANCNHAERECRRRFRCRGPWGSDAGCRFTPRVIHCKPLITKI